MNNAIRELKKAYEDYTENTINYDQLCEIAIEISEKEPSDSDLQEVVGEILQHHTTEDMGEGAISDSEKRIEHLLY